MTIAESLRSTGIFYVATSDGDEPKVRPFSSMAEIDGKIYLCTSNKKACYEQLINNPKLEIAAMMKRGSWLRLRAEAKFSDSRDLKERMLKDPSVPNKYSIDDGVFEIFSLENISCQIYHVNGEIEELK